MDQILTKEKEFLEFFGPGKWYSYEELPEGSASIAQRCRRRGWVRHRLKEGSRIAYRYQITEKGIEARKQDPVKKRPIKVVYVQPE